MSENYKKLKMKNLIYLFLLGLLVIACGGSEEEVNADSPTIPEMKSPEDGKVCLGNMVVFKWEKSTDINKEEVTYKLQVATDHAFTQIVKSAETIESTQALILEKNTTYYWRIKATNSKGLTRDYSPIYNFHTEGDPVANRLPFAPELVQPVLNSTWNTPTVTLSWNASDADPSDILTYDVYFGTTNSPTTKVGSNIGIKTHTVAVANAKEYFWKVVVKDNKGGETMGQVWKFKTN